MSNALANETSPYLRQHAENPVDWLPWGPEALERARRESKPILLSIGYAACHWCHVMAHESFENAAIAQLMNERFINIKVDREERPDIDRIYQIAQQMLTGRGGGWPLTMFLMPDDQRPFFGGTYFPPVARHGLPAFPDLLQHVADYCRDHSDELRTPATQVVAALERMQDSTRSSAPLTLQPLTTARAALQRLFEADNGGFGGAPKFPHPPFLSRLLRDWYLTTGQEQPDLQALYMVTLTLSRMIEGGLFDHLGGGFARYCVDEHWEIPHFEKMLYDNALLLGNYAETAAATGDARFREIAERTADWLLRELRAPGGGFYSSYDADSEGHEGKYYVWSREQLRALLDGPEYAAFVAQHGVDKAANFEGQWHLTRRREAPDAAAQALINSARVKLLAVRAQRVAPGLDDKILTSWNALAIRGLAIAARVLDRGDYAAAAGQALRFLRDTHWRDGRLLATSDGGAARFNAYLDDYAFLADAVLELNLVRFDAGELAFGAQLLDTLLAHFAAAERGGFFFTADDHETLISRSRSFSDDALPNGNGVAAVALQRYGWLLGNTRYLDAAESVLRGAWDELAKHGLQCATLLQALEERQLPPELIILRGDIDAMRPWQARLTHCYAPRRLVLAVPTSADALPEALRSKPAVAGATVTAYLCRGMTCSAPCDNLDALYAALD
jgi:uncharacterized protein YyaL (SSP411 family)